ncbi:MAG: phosphoenolpyruvate--protein phosphotransferase [Acidimicrobiales bacterium]
MTNLRGVGASPGVAIGPVVALVEEEVDVPELPEPFAAVTESTAAVASQLTALAKNALSRDRHEAADVLQAQALMAEDPMLTDAVGEHLDAGLGLGAALDAAGEQLEALLASLPDPYLAARAADVGEVVAAVRRDLAGLPPAETTLTEPSILVAHALTAAETADLDPAMVLGFATATGGATSHVAIIARALDVPAVVGVPRLLDTVPASAALDGSTGEFIGDPSAEVAEDFSSRIAAEARLRSRLEELRGRPASFGSVAVSVAANIGGPSDIDRAVAEGSDGVGLFRTEFLFLDRSTAPTEEEQYEAYSLAAKAWDDTVVIRTFDIGGDKPAPYLDLADEENPFLGIRGVRLYERYPDLFVAQVRAVYRAAAHGTVALMIPMVSTLDEFHELRRRVEAVRADLDRESVSIGDVSLGVMVEVPSVALTAHAFAEHVDFFSIGTNDLTQYTMAADRGEGELSHLHDPLHPAVLRLCEQVAAAGTATGTSVSVCGLAASDPLAAVIFAAVGVTKLSVSASAVNLIKATLGAQDAAIADEIRSTLGSASSAEEIRERLAGLIAQP